MAKLSKLSRSFILANIFDVISTALAMAGGAVEYNIIVVRFGWIIGGMAKLLAVIILVIIFEKTTAYKAYWIAPILVWITATWNFINFIVPLPVIGCAIFLLAAWIMMAITLVELVSEIGIVKAIGYIVIYPLLIAGTIVLYMKLYL